MAMKPLPGVGINAGHYLARDLAQRFLFNDRSTRPVGLVNGVQLTPIVSEAQTLVSAHDGGSIKFAATGSSGYFSGGTDVSTQDLALNGAFTIIARIRPPSASDVGGIAERSDGNTINQGWIFGGGGLNLGAKLVFTTTDLRCTAAGALTAGEWQWVSLHINGTSVANALITSSGISRTLTDTASGVGTQGSDAARSLLIGSNSFQFGSGSLNNGVWNGHISDIAFYRRCLSLTDLQTYINAPYSMLGSPQRRIWIAGSAAPPVVASGTVSFGAPTLSGTGVEGFPASGGVTFGAPTLAGAGDIIAPSTQRVSQLVVELTHNGTQGEQRVSQLAVELGNTGTSGAQRISQLAVELANTGTSQQRMSQLLVELGNTGAHQTRVAQLCVEVAFDARVSGQRVSQFLIELAYPNIDTPPVDPPVVLPPPVDDDCLGCFGDACVDIASVTDQCEWQSDSPPVTANQSMRDCFSDACDLPTNVADDDACFGD